jgi:type IX secretion system PorP/SprF family membrane protein
MKKLIIFSLVFFAFIYGTNAQDYFMSNPYANLLNLNPAFAGSLGKHRVIASYNMGLANYQMNNHTVNVSVDNHFNKLKGGLAFIFSSFSENEGSLVQMHGGLIYSPVFVCKEKITLKPAVELGYGYNTLYASNGLNNFKNFASKSYLDVDLGFLAYCDRLFGGVAAKHLTNPNISFYTDKQFKQILPIYFTAHIGGLALKPADGRVFQLAPSILFNMQGDRYQQYIYGLDAKYKKLKVGGYYIHNIYSNDNLAMGVGFDSDEFLLSFTHSFYLKDPMNPMPYQMANNEFTLTWKFSCCKGSEPNFKPLNLISF